MEDNRFLLLDAQSGQLSMTEHLRTNRFVNAHFQICVTGEPFFRMFCYVLLAPTSYLSAANAFHYALSIRPSLLIAYQLLTVCKMSQKATFTIVCESVKSS